MPEFDHVEPVPAHRRLLGSRQVPGRHAQAGQAGQAAGEQAALEGLSDLALDGEPGPLDRQRDAIRHELQQLDVSGIELAQGQAPGVQNPNHLPLDDHRDADKRADLLLAHQRVDHRHR